MQVNKLIKKNNSNNFSKENCPSSYHSSPSTTSYSSIGEVQWTRTMSESPELDLTAVIDYWYTEGASFSSGNINPF